METKTICLQWFVIQALTEMTTALDKDELTKEQRDAYNYFLKRFVIKLLDDKYTVTKNLYNAEGEDAN